MVYLMKPKKELICKMLNISMDRVNKLLIECRKYDIIRPISRGIYEVNPYLYSTGSIGETRNLQAQFDFENERYIVRGDSKCKLNGEIIRKTVKNRKEDFQQLNFNDVFGNLEDKEIIDNE